MEYSSVVTTDVQLTCRSGGKAKARLSGSCLPSAWPFSTSIARHVLPRATGDIQTLRLQQEQDFLPPVSCYYIFLAHYYIIVADTWTVRASRT